MGDEAAGRREGVGGRNESKRVKRGGRGKKSVRETERRASGGESRGRRYGMGEERKRKREGNEVEGYEEQRVQ